MKRAVAEEQMDAADLDPATYARVLTDLGKANRVTFAARPTLAFLARTGLTRFSLLDVGFGDGGMLRAIARWAERRGIAARLVGVDLNPKSAAVARTLSPGAAIEWRNGDYADQGRFDLIVSSLVAHHMTDDELVRFVIHMERHATAGWLVSDVRRSRFAHLGYPLLARAMGWHRIVREDGALSIARSRTAAEWAPLLAAAGAGGVEVYRAFPFKLCVARRH